MIWKIVLAIVILIVLWLIAIYNGLIRRKTRTNEAWSDIEVQLKRRYNLIPNLLETVKGYAAHERSVLQKVTEARTQAMQAQGKTEKAGAENMLSNTLKSLFAVAENYPGLKANQNFLELQNELSDTEDKIQAARRFYNSNVRDYNISLKVFPNNLVAKIFKFKPAEFFEIEETDIRKPLSVKF